MSTPSDSARWGIGIQADEQGYWQSRIVSNILDCYTQGDTSVQIVALSTSVWNNTSKPPTPALAFGARSSSVILEDVAERCRY